MGKLVLLQEKIDLLIDKNERLLSKATLKIKSETMLRHVEQALTDLSQQGRQSIKLEEKIKAHRSSLEKRVQELRDTTTSSVQLRDQSSSDLASADLE